MKFISVAPVVVIVCLICLAADPCSGQTKTMEKRVKGNYAPVNGVRIYYEIHGPETGTPLVLLHGGGSTIDTTFGVILPLLAKTRRVIAFDQQGHGRTADVDRPFTFEQSADDTAVLLKCLKVEKADFFGFSNGGTIAVQIAIRHPEIVRKLIIASANISRNGMIDGFWDSMANAKLEDMPLGLRESYLKTAPQPEKLQSFFDKGAARMREFKDIRPEDIRVIKAPALIIDGDKDVVRPEHAMEMFRLFPNARLAILPGGHGTYMEEVSAGKKVGKLPEITVALIEEFLDTQNDKTK